MELSVIALLFGIGIGLLFRKKKKIIQVFDGSAMVFIIILLFLMGLSLGTNRVVLQNITGAGIYALVISLGGIAGSICFSLPVYHFLFRGHENEK